MTLHRLPTWREMNMDTSPEIEKIQFAIWRDMPIWKKWQMVSDLNEMARNLAMSGLRKRYPQATPELLRRLWFDLLLGPELAERVYGPMPKEGLTDG
jgi:hypothetical protein